MCVVDPFIVYGCEPWTITTKKYMTKLQSFEMLTYRKMMKKSWKERKTNKEVLKLQTNILYAILFTVYNNIVHVSLLYSSTQQHPFLWRVN